ncbi:MAG TPA: SDR family oxidoreductase [Spongiibacteraceae bacterium]|jgi:NAD(P)-dependent dehydrogenase (short-subunit alcohol dehydrogenase family)
MSDSIAVITGGGGSMGLACARKLGRLHRLVLVDIDATRIDAAAATLIAEGFKVTPLLADLTVADSINDLVKTCAAFGPFGALVHTAGLSPTMADGVRIMALNLLSTVALGNAFLPLAGPGTVAVMIASSAGHLAPSDSDRDRLLDNPLADNFWSEMALICVSSALSYVLSKRGVIRYCEQAATAWGARGARIVSISPGIIATPMSKLEFEQQPGMATMLDNTPLRRQGNPDDIAAAVEFLCSPAASYITGTDLRIDGGVTPVHAAYRAARRE